MAEGGVDLRNSQEVQEYVDNLGIEYRFGCFREKNPKGITSKMSSFLLLFSKIVCF